MDDFREWLSDNLRYFMLGGVILIIVAVLFFGIRACTGSRKGASDETTTASDDSRGNDPSSQNGNGESDEKNEDTNPLEEGSEEITTLMQNYYKALGDRDITTLETLVSDLTPADESRITNAKDYLEGYKVDSVYTKQGLDENSYVVYTRGSFICTGIDTPAPALWNSYVTKDSEGTYKIVGDLSSNADITAYMEQLKSDDDVVALTEETQSALDAAEASDSNLKSFLDGLGEETDSSASGSAAVGTILTATETCNVRAEASSDGEIIGGLDEGDEVEKLGQEGEWIQIEYDGETGYVHSSLLE